MSLFLRRKWDKGGRTMKEKKKGFFGKLLSALGTFLLVIVLLIGILVGFLSATEYKPADTETLTVENGTDAVIPAGAQLKIMTWNIGYGALGDNADFFMDGGTMVNTADIDRVNENMSGIIARISAEAPDLLLIQEADVNSNRSKYVDETALLRESFSDMDSTFANNFKVAYLPYPIPPIGKVDSGLLTLSRYNVSEADRVQLPIPFAWPMRMANLKRCVTINRIPVDGGKELVLVNLHLEAYDDGAGKVKQTEMLKELLSAEAAKGNYVIAGGDFNQIFSSEDISKFPIREGMWACGQIDVSSFGEGWQFIMDETAPSCRSLDKAYKDADKTDFQYYLIDGFIVSGNVKVESYETKDFGFVNTDHNPVVMNVTLQ